MKTHGGIKTLAASLVIATAICGCASSDSDDRANLSAAPKAKSLYAVSAAQVQSAPSSDVTEVKHSHKADFSSYELAYQAAQAQGFELGSFFTPYKGSKSRIYGTTSAGCIAGAHALDDSNEDFQVQRRGPRNYAHPMMVQYLKDLRDRSAQLGLPPLLIGDIALQYGGTYGLRSAHASHNTGIDVDLPFDFALPRKSAQELANPEDVYIVKGSSIQPAFTKSIEVYIKAAASDPRVDRIFVAPMIKKHMCRVYENKPMSGFLSKLRPWFGHQAHMHVRLKCPIDSPDCVAQAPVPEGLGCGYEVDSWLNPPPPSATKKVAKRRVRPALPEQCKLVQAGIPVEPILDKQEHELQVPNSDSQLKPEKAVTKASPVPEVPLAHAN